VRTLATRTPSSRRALVVFRVVDLQRTTVTDAAQAAPVPGTAADAGRARVSFFEQYGTFAILVIVGAGLYAVIMLVNRLVRPTVASPDKLTTYECGVDPTGTGWSQTNIRYYVFAFLFVIFDVEAIFLFPWAVIVGTLDATTTPSATYALVAMFLFIGTLLEGLAYAWKKGVLKWD
jgi:NADH-quinone oxidoreductase subunit A